MAYGLLTGNQTYLTAFYTWLEFSPYAGPADLALPHEFELKWHFGLDSSLAANNFTRICLCGTIGTWIKANVTFCTMNEEESLAGF